MSKPQFNDAIHPYSPVRRAGDLLFVAGQLGVDDHGSFSGDVVEETHRALDHLEARLAEQGASLHDVVKVNVYLADMADRAAFDPIYTARFEPPQPARRCIAAGALPFDARVEIDAVAHLPTSLSSDRPSHD